MDEAYKIIQTYCGDIQKRIQACRSKGVAESLVDNLCNKVNHYCQSDVVRNILKNYSNEIIKKTFNQQGKNRLLEEKDEKL